MEERTWHTDVTGAPVTGSSPAYPPPPTDVFEFFPQGSGPPRLLLPVMAFVLGVVVLIVSVGLVLFSRSKSDDTEAAAPPDACRLVPEDLLTRVVPDAQEVREPGRDEPSIRSSSCRLFTGNPEGELPRSGKLIIVVRTYGSTSDSSPRKNAGDSFVLDKRAAGQKAEAGQVMDVSGLGDSAFIQTTTDPSKNRSSATLRALSGTAIVEIEYDATPATPDTTAAATVAVARAALEQLT